MLDPLNFPKGPKHFAVTGFMIDKSALGKGMKRNLVWGTCGSPRVCKPWFPNRGSRLPDEQRLKEIVKRFRGGTIEVKQR